MSYCRDIRGRSPLSRLTNMGKNNRKKIVSQGKLNQSFNNSKNSDSSSESDNLEHSINSTPKTVYDLTPNTSRLGTDFSNLSTSGGSTSTPINSRNESGEKIKRRVKHSDSELSSTSIKSKSKNFQQDSSFPSKTIFVVFLVILCAYWSFGRLQEEKTKSIETNFLKQMDDIKSKFHLKDDTIWDDFIVGITDVINLNRQAVFLLIYSDNGDTVHKLSRSVGKIAAQIIKSDDIYPIEVSYRNLNNDLYIADHGKLITKYRDELADHAVLIVHDLHLLKGSVARAFHTICDEFNPLVLQSVIIFTMNVNDLHGKATEIGENRLKEVWAHELDPDILSPLVTRLTGNVLKIV